MVGFSNFKKLVLAINIFIGISLVATLEPYNKFFIKQFGAKNVQCSAGVLFKCFWDTRFSFTLPCCACTIERNS